MRLTSRGFTLSELLIALVILGVIATFTIPKVLSTQADGKSKSIVKEVAGMVSGAYQAYQLNNVPNASTSMANLTPFMNYVRVDTTSTIDDANTLTSESCSTGTCLWLHNGAIFYYDSVTVGGAAVTNAIPMMVDPDGKYGGATTGPSKSTGLFLYLNGRIVTNGTIEPNTCDSGGCNNPTPSYDPSYFSWN